MAGSAAGRPTGTVAFLFTDVVGSTRLWEQHPDAMRIALTLHDEILRNAIEAHGGFVFSTAGDAFSAAFMTPRDAVLAAVDAQRALQAEAWPDSIGISVRMGVHLGAAHERDGDYFGSAVNRTARLMGLAHGGQVLVSLPVEGLLRDELPAGVHLLGLGEHELRGLSRPESVFQLLIDGLLDEFPPLVTSTSVPGNLPSPPTSFVGRADDLKRLAEQIPAHRLVTLVGVGGVGKTRLAIEAAATLIDEFPDGLYFVDLARLSGAEAVVHAVAETLSVSPEQGSSLLESTVAALHGRRILVVLDNCEHVIDAAAEVAAAIASGAAMASVVATSREPLATPGEQLWPVAPLDPVLEAVELFVERAVSVDPSFSPTDTERDLLVGLCSHLDGVPLAIELAASRLRSMSLAQLADRLGDRFRILRSSARGGVIERHQTLHATVDWSYRLLDTAEQVLFDRSSVFAGSFDLGAAETVCGFDPIDQFDVFDLLGSLVDKSLVILDRDHDRYRLLETLRQFGADRLEERSELDLLRDRHLDCFVEIARRANTKFEGSEHLAGIAAFEAAWDDFRAAFGRAEETENAGTASLLIDSLFIYAYYWLRHELGDWAARAARMDPRDPIVLGAAGAFAWVRGDQQAALDFGQAGVDAAESPYDPRTQQCWFALCVGNFYSGRGDLMWSCVQGMIAAGRSSESDFRRAMAEAGAISGAVMFDTDESHALAESAQAAATRLRNDTLIGYLAYQTGNAAAYVDDYDRAFADYRRALDCADRTGNRVVDVLASSMMAVRADQADWEDPGAIFRDTLGRLYANKVWSRTWMLGGGLAEWWASTGRINGAAVLVGFLDRHDPDPVVLVAEQRVRARSIVDAHTESSQLLAEGAAMSRDEIVAYCLDRLSDA